MTCEIQYFNSNIRRLFVECQETILDQYNIHESQRLQIEGIWYLVLSVDSSDYTRIEEGERTELVSTRSGDFISPKLVKVGFEARIINQSWNVFQCLSFLAISSVSTAYNSFVPCVCLDYVRPEVTDVSYTKRIGRLSVRNNSGSSGSGTSNAPLYTNEYQINFVELGKRLIA